MKILLFIKFLFYLIAYTFLVISVFVFLSFVSVISIKEQKPPYREIVLKYFEVLKEIYNKSFA
jgi:hypothetical protein